MIFHPIEIAGAYLIEPERESDRRGFHARHFLRDELEERGLDPTLVRCEVSVHQEAGEVSGLHWQDDPHPMARLVRCTQGKIHDVILDLRPGSPSYLQEYSVELSHTNRRALYVPAGCAHGYQTLLEGTEVFHQLSEFAYPESARGVRWNDPAFSIVWPLEISRISEQDTSFPDYEPLIVHSLRKES